MSDINIDGLSAGALNADLVPSVDVSGYRWASVQINGTWVGTFTFQASNDGVIWVDTNVTWPALTVSNVLRTTATFNSIYIFPIYARYIRVRMTAYTSGTATGTLLLSRTVMPAITSGAVVVQQGTWITQNTPRDSGGLSMSSTVATATTNETVVKAVVGQVYSIYANNTNAAVRYLKLYNKATVPIVGTDVPAMTLAIPAAGVVAMDVSCGLAFSAGIAFALTAGVAATDIAAVAANEHVVNIGFK